MEYAAMLAGLCLKEEGGKWSRRLVRAGGSEQLYSGVTIRKPSLSWKMTMRVIMRSAANLYDLVRVEHPLRSSGLVLS